MEVDALKGDAATWKTEIFMRQRVVLRQTPGSLMVSMAPFLGCSMMSSAVGVVLSRRPKVFRKPSGELLHQLTMLTLLTSPKTPTALRPQGINAIGKKSLESIAQPL